MTDFEERLKSAATLENTFIKSFNKHCEDYQIIKYGIESTALRDVHKLVRSCRDSTSKFIRYIPDSVIINTSDAERGTTLIEFKAAKTGVREDSFFRQVQSECRGMKPPLTSKEDIFNIEKDALKLYLDLNTIGVKTIVVAYAHFRGKSSRLFAQFVENIGICNSYNPNIRGRNIGSGTWLSNVNLASFKKVGTIFNEVFNIDTDVLLAVQKDVIQAFEAQG